MQRVSLIGLCLATMIVLDSTAFAQGLQTGTVTGLVQSVDRVALPGVRVTAVSAALQGQRTTVTDVNGVYYLRALPVGTYAVSLELSDFQPSTRGCAPSLVEKRFGATLLLTG